MRRLTLVVSFIVLLAACGRGENASVRRQLAKADRAALLNDARKLHAEYTAKYGTNPGPPGSVYSYILGVPDADWPHTFHQFHPKRISVTRDGVWIPTYRFFEDEAGLFIACETERSPRNVYTSFELIEGFFYFYRRSQSQGGMSL